MFLGWCSQGTAMSENINMQAITSGSMGNVGLLQWRVLLLLGSSRINRNSSRPTKACKHLTCSMQKPQQLSLTLLSHSRACPDHVTPCQTCCYSDAEAFLPNTTQSSQASHLGEATRQAKKRPPPTVCGCNINWGANSDAGHEERTAGAGQGSPPPG